MKVGTINIHRFQIHEVHYLKKPNSMKIEAIIRRSVLKNTGSETNPFFDIYILYFLVLKFHLSFQLDRNKRLTEIRI